MAESHGTCTVDGCTRVSRKRGFCEAHYQRVVKHGDPRADVPIAARGVLEGSCLAPGCDRMIQNRTRGLCDAHYKRVWRDGGADLAAPVAPPRAHPVPAKDFEDGTRECQECGLRKPLDAFHKDSRSPRGHRKACKACRVAQETRRYWSDPESHRARMRDFRAGNIERVREREARYYEANRDARIESAIENSHRRRASLSGARRDAGISRAALRRLDGSACCYCGVEMMFGSFPKGERPDNQATIEHVVPVSRGGSHTWENCTLACWRCNISKGARDGDWRIRAGHRLALSKVEVGA